MVFSFIVFLLFKIYGFEKLIESVEKSIKNNKNWILFDVMIACAMQFSTEFFKGILLLLIEFRREWFIILKVWSVGSLFWNP